MSGRTTIQVVGSKRQLIPGSGSVPGQLLKLIKITLTSPIDALVISKNETRS